MSTNSFGEYKKDIQVGITTLVASLGFFKIQELTDFIKSLKDYSLESVNMSTTDYTMIIFPFLGVIIYFGYLLSIAASLFFIYQDKAINHQKSVFSAVSCYFGLQVLLIIMLMGTK